jgi:hypothetical protein
MIRPSTSGKCKARGGPFEFNLERGEAHMTDGLSLNNRNR